MELHDQIVPSLVAGAVVTGCNLLSNSGSSLREKLTYGLEDVLSLIGIYKLTKARIPGALMGAYVGYEFGSSII